MGAPNTKLVADTFASFPHEGMPNIREEISEIETLLPTISDFKLPESIQQELELVHLVSAAWCFRLCCTSTIVGGGLFLLVGRTGRFWHRFGVVVGGASVVGSSAYG